MKSDARGNDLKFKYILAFTVGVSGVGLAGRTPGQNCLQSEPARRSSGIAAMRSDSLRVGGRSRITTLVGSGRPTVGSGGTRVDIAGVIGRADRWSDRERDSLKIFKL